MKPKRLLAIPVGALLFASSPAFADEDHASTGPGAPLASSAVPAATVFTSTLNGANERPNPVVTPGFGTGQANLSGDNNLLTVALTFQGLTSGTRAAHIHCCVGSELAGPVAVDFTAFPGELTSGSFSGVFDLSLASTYGGGFLSANGSDPLQARATFLNGLQSGQTYFNIHTALNPGGEIRGQLAALGPISAVPEPATWATMLAGFAMTGVVVRRRKRSGLRISHA